MDSCKSGYSEIIAEHFKNFMEEMRNDAIPIHVQIRQARYNEYHMMRGCFYMVRNAWIEEIADFCAVMARRCIRRSRNGVIWRA